MVHLPVFVIIVNFNGANYLPDCLKSLKKQTFKNYGLVVVDNASQDKSRNLVTQFFPEAKLILNTQNFGFPAAANLGIRYSLENGADYIILLGFDTLLENSWLGELVKAAKIFPQTGIFQSKILLCPQKERINSLGNEIHFLGFGFCSHYLEKDFPELRQTREIAYASGATMLVKKQVFEKIGFFDEKIMFLEDLDFCWRARLLGLKIMLAPLSRVYHHYQFSRYSQKYYFLERGRFLVLLKNYRLKTLILLFPALALSEIIIFFYALFSGWLFDKIRAEFYILKNLNYALKERFKIQKLRKISDREVANYFASKINLPDLEKNPVLKLANFLADFYWQSVKNLI